MHQCCLAAAVTIILGFSCWSVQSMRCELLSVKKGSKTNLLVNYTVRKVDLLRTNRPPLGFEKNLTQLVINRVLNNTAVDHHRTDPSSYSHQYEGSRHKALIEMRRSKSNTSTKKRNKGMVRRHKNRRKGQRNNSTPRRNRRRDLKVKSVECESTGQQGSVDLCQPQPVKACMEEADNCINITCVCVYRPSIQIFNLGEVA